MELYEIFQQNPVITSDSRDCPSGSIFFALKGETFDGNQYAVSALEKGCAYAVIDDKKVKESADKNFAERLILVPDVLKAMQDLANTHRKALGTPIIGVTGTNGKTTTKELISAVLAKKYNVHFTQGNFNNHIGVPKTLLQLTKEHEMAVVEMGANHPGEIKTLVNIVEPDYGIITNVGKAHLLGFGSFEGVIHTKGELYDFLRDHKGKVFINNDNPHLKGISRGLELIRYGQTKSNSLLVKGQLISSDPFLTFSMTMPSGKKFTVMTKLIGAYNIDNCLAAATIGTFFGVSDENICEAISEYTPTNNRSQFKKTEKNSLIIDAYNANPTSMAAALDNFRHMQADHKTCILGAMRELGEASVEEHSKILAQLSKCGVEEVWLVGEEWGPALKDQLKAINSHTFANINEVKDYLSANPLKDKTILVKGSNSTRLIDITDML